jgi:multicomponent Na+:H+ antiporter subunit D
MWSKWYLGLGAVSGEHWALLAVLMISSLLNIVYLLPIPIRAFLARPPEGETRSGLREAPVTCLLAMAVTSLACVLLFFYPDPFYELAAAAAGAP